MLGFSEATSPRRPAQANPRGAAATTPPPRASRPSAWAESAEAFTDGSGDPHGAALGGRHPGQLPRGLGSARLLLSVSVIFLIQNNSAHPKRTSRRAGGWTAFPDLQPRIARALAMGSRPQVPRVSLSHQEPGFFSLWPRLY